MKDFETVYAAKSMTLLDITRIPNEKLEEITRRELTHILANFILENLDELPVMREEREDPERGGRETRIRVNLISDKEYKRLKEIERMSEMVRFE